MPRALLILCLLVPGQGKKRKSARQQDVISPVDQIDPDEPLYCLCHQVSHVDVLHVDVLRRVPTPSPDSEWALEIYSETTWFLLRHSHAVPQVTSFVSDLLQVSYGEMICCDNEECSMEWFHFSCVSLNTKPKGKWFCPRCRGDRSNQMKKIS